MKTLAWILSVSAALAQNYGPANTVNGAPVARLSFLRSQYINGNALLDQSIIAWWPIFASTANQLDYSGNGNVGVPGGAFQAPLRGKISPLPYYFNKGIPNSIVATNNITLPTNFTVSAWVNPFAPTSGGLPRIIESDYKTSLFLGLNSTNSAYQAVLNVGSGSIGTCQTGTPVTGGVTWQFVAVTYDGANAHVYAFINGTMTDSGACPFTYSTPVSKAFRIGGCAISMYCGGTGTGWWDGQIQDVRIYNRTLSSAELTAIYNTENN